MNKKSARRSLLNKSAMVAMSIQLTLGTTSVLAAGEQTLMNTSLPLPTRAKSVAMRAAAAPAPVVTPVVAAPPVAAVAPAPVTPAVIPPEATTDSMWDVSGNSDAPALRPQLPADGTAAQPSDSAELRPAIPVAGEPAAVNVVQALAPTAAPPTPTAEQKLETNSSWNDDEKLPMSELQKLVAPQTVATPGNDASAAFKLSEPIKQNSNMALLPKAGVPATDPFHRGLIVIDNDEEIEQQATIEYEDLPLDDETKTKVKAGARFPIVITSEITSRTAKVGDPIQARLKFDLKIGDRLVASKGSIVRGHLNYALKARTPLAAMVSTNRWYKNSGCLGIAFDEIINERNEHIPLLAEPAKSPLYVKNKAEGRVLGINHRGQIAGPWSQQLQYKAVRVGMNFAMAPLGAMSFGAMPVALGVIGAINPSFAFMKPVGTNVRHRRLKGFAWGFLSGVPGSWLIEDTTVKGQEAVIKPGDEFLAELRQEFTGEPATDAEMLGGGDGKVHGEVVGAKNNKVERKKKRAAKSSPQA